MVKLTEAEMQRSTALVSEFLRSHPTVNNRSFRELTGFSYDQAITFFKHATAAGFLERRGSGSTTHYVSLR